jgi:hypothetical protein
MREKMKTSKKGEKLNFQERVLFTKGCCPDCGAPVLEGPSGGLSVNYLCASALCQAKFNEMGPFGVERLTDRTTVPTAFQTIPFPVPPPVEPERLEETPYRTPAERLQEPVLGPSLLLRLLYRLRWLRLSRWLLGGHWERFWDYGPRNRWKPWQQLEECSEPSCPDTAGMPLGYECEDYTLRLFHGSPVGPDDSRETILNKAVDHFDMRTPETSVFVLAELQRLAHEGSTTQREDAVRFLRWYNARR